MSIFEFGPNDVLRNTMKTFPRCRFTIYDTKVFYNEQADMLVSPAPRGNVDLYELNPGRADGGPIYNREVAHGSPDLCYPFIIKTGKAEAFSSVSTASFNEDYQYGDQIDGSYPLYASITRQYFPGDSRRGEITSSLRNPMDYYSILSREFTGTLSACPVSMINIPQIFYGSGIKKGSMHLRWFHEGALIGELHDKMRNGLLLEATGANVGAVGGLAMYDHGIVLLTGSWALDDVYSDTFTPGEADDNPRWIYFGTTGSTNANGDGTNVPNSCFQLDFEGINYIPSISMFAHAKAGELNCSQNPTWRSYGQVQSPMTGSGFYRERENIEIKNISTGSFSDATGTFQKQTSISRIAIFDEERNILGWAKLANPVRKREKDSFTFKLKVDL